MRDPDTIYGTGIQLPLLRHPGFSWISGGDAVTQSLRAVLLTEPGERIGRPTFGVGLRRYLFAPNNLATRAAMRQDIVDAVARDEPRVRLDEVDIRVDAIEPTLLRIELHYHLKDDPGPRSLVLPFYLDQGAA
ncbi:MAG: GPW/gp25 family protein [Candidatus Thiodiazotropha sp. (ex Ctena orbiculata)]|uniref:GPW/gp25 family protein n=1 Tax=Candidatus Thiodiazotropha taylori TaxID=2792791 RepID=A0A944M6F8_9GAMM|nr:GPW/gp25 family protein [Candidatus Thiodiazotropha taylori]MBV2138777.1 GPW/gp25 family protein [Candidatus Thiodiazotropha taylori]